MKTVSWNEAELMSYEELCGEIPADDKEFLSLRNKTNREFKRAVGRDLFEHKPNVYDLVHIANQTKIPINKIKDMGERMGVVIEESRNLHSRIYINVKSLFKRNIELGIFKEKQNEQK